MLIVFNLQQFLNRKIVKFALTKNTIDKTIPNVLGIPVLLRYSITIESSNSEKPIAMITSSSSEITELKNNKLKKRLLFTTGLPPKVFRSLLIHQHLLNQLLQKHLLPILKLTMDLAHSPKLAHSQ